MENIRDESGKRLISDQEILSIKNRDIIDYKDTGLILVIVNLIREIGYKDLNNFLDKVSFLKDKRSIKSEIIFNNPLTKNLQEKSIENIKSYEKKPENVEGLFGECAKCKSLKISYVQIQTRSADEPMTIIITCVECDNTWKR
uniref:Transcription factor S-II n=1 Tax=Pithovirus LCPAC104 TaxID=2506589 RepID=A0A481Z529_9VIRU|nr:MAG: transcription factor S-II [Pithovirus LCPAC104]